MAVPPRKRAAAPRPEAVRNSRRNITFVMVLSLAVMVESMAGL
jgi:hypothetical protein